MFDELAEALSTAERLMRRIEPGALIGTEPARMVELLTGHQRVTASAELVCIARAESQQQWEREGYNSFAEWLAARQGTSTAAASRRAGTARRLGENPRTAEALADGEISEDQADVVSDAAAKDPSAERELLDTAKNEGRSHKDLKDKAAKTKAAAESDAERARRLRRGRSGWWGTDRDGFWTLRARLEPHVGAEAKAALDAEVERIFDLHRRNGDRELRDRYRADAVANLLTRATPNEPAEALGARGDRNGRSDRRTASTSRRSDADRPHSPELDTDRADTVPGSGSTVDTADPVTDSHLAGSGTRRDLVLDINLQTYRRGHLLSGETCEIRGVGPVPVEIARQWADDAFIKVVIRDGNDPKLVCHLGRHINAELRTALDLIDRTCAVPGCDNPRLEYDHHQRHTDLGPTSWWNLRRPCHTHHQQITHHGYRLEGERGDRVWIHPDGHITRADNPNRTGQPWHPPNRTYDDEPAASATATDDAAEQLDLLTGSARAP